MKKIFILLLTVVLMASSFVSCNKTEAEAETVFRLADGKDGSAEFKALSEQFGKIASYEDAVAAVEAAVAFNDNASMIVSVEGEEMTPIKSSEIAAISADSVNGDNYMQIKNTLITHKLTIWNLVAGAICESIPEENQRHIDTTKMNAYVSPLICYFNVDDGDVDTIEFDLPYLSITYYDQSENKSYTLYPPVSFDAIESKCREEATGISLSESAAE